MDLTIPDFLRRDRPGKAAKVSLGAKRKLIMPKHGKKVGPGKRDLKRLVDLGYPRASAAAMQPVTVVYILSRKVEYDDADKKLDEIIEELLKIHTTKGKR